MDAFSTQPTLDSAALNANTLHDPELQRELFELFFDQAPTYLAQMDEAISDQTRETWARGAHGMKGASRSLGLARLAALAQSAEHAQPCAARRDALVAELENARAASERYLAEAPSAAARSEQLAALEQLRQLSSRP